MSEHRINPEKVTKPIQLLAAWLVGLIVVNASFLVSAQQISRPEWVSGLLVICSVINVPVFIGALFLLQTKFRPQMQEDSFYSQYLERENRYTQRSSPGPDPESIAKEVIVETTEKILQSLGKAGVGKEKPIEQILRTAQFNALVKKVGKSRALSELYKSPQTWKQFVKVYEENKSFIGDMDLLLAEGIVTNSGNEFSGVQLTKLGREVVQHAEKENALFYQRNLEWWERRWQRRRQIAKPEAATEDTEDEA